MEVARQVQALWDKNHLEPARRFLEDAAMQLGAIRVELFDSRVYGLSLPSSDADVVSILPSGTAAVSDGGRWLQTFAARLCRPP